MPSYKRSRYAAVNERRRKREWNSRSTGQLGRRRVERLTDLQRAEDRLSNPRGKRSRHGLVNTGYLAALMAQREEILQEAGIPLSEREEMALQRKREALPEGMVPVAVQGVTREGEPALVTEHLRSPPRADYRGETIEQNEAGEWVARGKAYRYRTDAEAALLG